MLCFIYYRKLVTKDELPRFLLSKELVTKLVKVNQ